VQTVKTDVAPRDTPAGRRPLRQAGGCDGAPRHDCRTILTFVARISQMVGDACAIVLLSERMNLFAIIGVVVVVLFIVGYLGFR
jgi:hypothetical protein